RCAKNPQLSAVQEIFRDPGEAAQNMQRHRPSYIGTDQPLEPNKIVASGDLPVRVLRVQAPACEILGFEFQRMERQTNRPFTLKAIALASKQLVIRFRPARIVTLDIDDVPSPDPAGFARSLGLHLLASRPVHGEAMRNCCVTRLQEWSAPGLYIGARLWRVHHCVAETRLNNRPVQ